MAINYVVCAAGEGRRFEPVLGDIPKPAIRLRGTTLLEWAMTSLPIRDGDVIIVITQARHRLRDSMYEVIGDAHPSNRLEWIELPSSTRGQLETALAAEPHLQSDGPLAIYNCDTFFRSATLADLMSDEAIEGIIPCSREPGSAWSFCQVDPHDRVIRIEERVRIAPWATAGLYFFRDPRRFLERARSAVEGGPSGELYVAPLYQQYIDSGEIIRMDRVSVFQPMGTPEQIETYWNVSVDALRAENR